MDAIEFLKEWKRLCSKYGQGCEGCPMCLDDICLSGTPSFYVDEIEKIVKKVENWAKTHPVLNLTEDQKTAIKGRIAEGYKYVFRNKDVEHVTFSDEEPEVYENGCFTLPGRRDSFTFSNFYDFVTFENSPLYLPYLLGGEE